MQVIDTTHAGVRSYLDEAAKITKRPWHSQVNHVMASAMAALDIMGITDPKDRNAFWKIWSAMPAGFASNASQLNQALGHKGGRGKLDLSAFEIAEAE